MSKQGTDQDIDKGLLDEGLSDQTQAEVAEALQRAADEDASAQAQAVDRRLERAAERAGLEPVISLDDYCRRRSEQHREVALLAGFYQWCGVSQGVDTASISTFDALLQEYREQPA